MISDTDSEEEKYRITTTDTGRTHWCIDLCDFFLRRRIFQKPIPLIASFKLTYRCNLRCRGCPFHLRADSQNGHMSGEAAIQTLQKLKQLGTRIIVFEGGEPFLWRDGSFTFNDLVRFAEKQFLRIAVTTNGTFPLDAPVDVVWVSVDGTKEKHDRLRSQSFDRVWSNIATATHHKILIHYTLNRENWQDLKELVKNVRNVPSIKGITVQFFYPYDQGEDTLTLSQEERRAAVDNVIRLKRKGYPILNSENRLKAMIENRWQCHDDILVNVDPDGSITVGCYAKKRGEVKCNHCGFTPVAEASGALDLSVGSLLAGWNIFIRK
jgi:MoaA/NifB/PqqE/SkfB family radical SAM enzyme